MINRDHGYTYRPEKFEFIEGVFDACKRFSLLGYQLVVVTNQSGIARGYYTEDDFLKLTDWMLGQFSEQGIDIAKVYYCPHHPTSGKGKYLKQCECRKPEPGMLLQATEELDIQLSESFMIGDKLSDMKAGEQAGVRECILLDGTVKCATISQGYRTFSRLSEVTLNTH